MKKSLIFIFAAVVSMFFCVDTSARTVTGKVVCGQQKLSNVIVTDGFKFTKTKKGKPVTNWKRTAKSNHYFAAKPSEGAKKITIIISNPFGQEWVENIIL